MLRKALCFLAVGSFLLLALFAISYATQQSDSDEAPVLAPSRALVPVPNFTDEIAWTIGTNMPTTRYSAVTGTYGGEIFVAVGRQSDSAPYNTAVCEAYDYGADTWRTNCASAPAALRMSAFGAMFEDEYLYVVGGRDNSSLTVGSLYIYNMATNAWTTGPDCLGRWAHGGAVLDGYVYVFGSATGTPAPQNSAQRYNIASNTWETIAGLPSGDGWVCGAAAAGKVYCIGGSTNSTRMLEYNPASNTWTTRAPIPHARTYSTAITHNNLIYVIGGNVPYANLVDVYDPATNTWSAETNTPGNICWEALGVSEAAIYVIGGTPQSSPVQYQNQVWIGALEAPEMGNIEGVVLEAAGANDPIEDAAVVLRGDTSWTNALGEYSFTDVPVGQYDITASAFGYNSETHTIDIIAGQTITQDFALTQPLISVDITEIDIDAAVGVVHDETFNISNLGDGELTFDIEVNLEGGGGGIETILVVDDDGGPGYMDVQQYYYDALDDAGYTYDTFDASVAGPTYAQMADYDLVIWFTGENWEPGTTLTGTDESNLEQYLDAGGHLFLSAQDYFYDAYSSAGPFSAGQFPYDYLGVTSTTQDNWSLPFSTAGSTGSFAEGMSFQCANPYSLNTLYPDMIVTSGTQLLTINAGGVACQFEGANFKTAFTALSFEGLTDGAAPNTKAQFMENMISWMGSRDAGIVQAPPRPTVAPAMNADVLASSERVGDRVRSTYCGPVAPAANPFETDEPWLTVTPSTGTIQPQESEMITSTFEMPDTAEVGEIYEGQIIIHNNSVLTPITIPVTVHIVSAVGDKSEVTPLEYALHQNYPNPFNPTTDIRFDLRQTGHVSLAIYNVLGQKVATLADRAFEAGSHSLTFNASSLASGVYFYRIEAGQFTDMKKMILLK